MIKEDKKIVFFLLAITVILTFTFTLANYINEMGQAKAPWLHRTEKDLILELRMDIENLHCALSMMYQENNYLRRLVYTTKPDHWTTWLELMDECKRLKKKIEEQDRKIKILETKLGIRLWEMPAPYRRI